MPLPHSIQILASLLFAVAVLHTFSASHFRRLASRFPEGSLGENCFHLLGEVEVVFGLWAGVLFLGISLAMGSQSAIRYVESLNFTEPLFVFAVMVVAATRPMIEAASRLILGLARILPLTTEVAVYSTCLVVGPLLGSLITEPAAMTVTALLLRDRYFQANYSSKFKYVTLAVLFVNVSIGGVLTHFAAPPVLMVATKWGWDAPFMFLTFGWKATLAVLLNSGLASFLLRKELREISSAKPEPASPKPLGRPPELLIFIHLLFMVLIIATAHHPVIFMGLLLFFIGIATITQEYQDELAIRPALLVSFFLGGLVVLGGLQGWWIDPLLRQLDSFTLFLGTAALTAFTDNAALTYLGSQVEGTSAAFRFSLVAGAVAGGGMTVIANAPNPAGYSILQGSFGPEGVRPARLALAALGPTAVALACLWLL